MGKVTNNYYTVEQIAEMLELHPKTVQRYIREGRLKANKVGKGWRIAGRDFNVFAEGTASAAKNKQNAVSGKKEAEDRTKVSAVIDIEVSDLQEALRLGNGLTLTVHSKTAELGAATLNTQYIESESKLRTMIFGSASMLRALLDAIEENGNHTGS